MKTPAEIKKELRNAKHVQCMDISDGENECVGTRYGVLVGYVLRDEIYIYITQLESDNESKQKRIDDLESRLALVERERDTLAAALEGVKFCGDCLHLYSKDQGMCLSCSQDRERSKPLWQWRGPCHENTKEDSK